MKCPHHPRVEAVGYCCICGAFGCEECLKKHEGQWYCPKHHRPIAKKIEEQKHRENIRRKHPRQRMVVRYLDGTSKRGICYVLNLQDTGFHLDLIDGNDAPIDESVFIPFADLKAIFLVKSFDGRFDQSARYREYDPEGGEIVVEFKDGEVLKGFAFRRFDKTDPRFHVIPSDNTGNNISVIVEMAAVERVYTAEEWEKKQEELGLDKGSQTNLSQEESTGDFYFEARNYTAALEQYRLAEEKFPSVRRLRTKVLSSQFNVGVQYIKDREYEKALAVMEAIHEVEPRNERVRRKIHKLRHVVRKMKQHQETD
ncbi:MAG: hypothetical protein GWP08_00650 [Nitrospiraceae bacterium]|nr:hypothetical protein [Nitrospiraceae bacterium]